MDWLDVAKPSKEYTATATYYEDDIDDPSIGGQSFRYNYVDPLSKTYRMLFENIQSTDGEGECTIATVDKLPFSLGAYVKTQDGKYYQIKQALTDFSDAPKQALRILPIPVGTRYVIRMVRVDNPWGIT